MSITAIAITLALANQDTPVEIPKSDLPKAAECVICTANGAGHGEEKPAAGVNYKGKSYYFCNAKEVAEFKADPVAFLPPVLPRPMPKFDLADTSGKQWNTETMKDKVVLVDFWATWCGPCKEMKPLVDKAHAEFKSKGFEVLSVSIDEKEATLTDHLKQNIFTNPVLFDKNQTWAEWKVRVIPTFFVVKNGQIVDQWSGKKSQKELNTLIESHLPENK